MHSDAATPQEYIDSLPEDRKPALSKLRQVIKKNIPKGFKETMGYGMVGFVVPHSLYPPADRRYERIAGGNCNPDGKKDGEGRKTCFRRS